MKSHSIMLHRMNHPIKGIPWFLLYNVQDFGAVSIRNTGQKHFLTSDTLFRLRDSTSLVEINFKECNTAGNNLKTDFRHTSNAFTSTGALDLALLFFLEQALEIT